MHLEGWHENFVFEIDESERTNAEIKKTVKVEIVDGYAERAANHVKDARTFFWQKPRGPVNIEASSGEGQRTLNFTAPRIPVEGLRRGAIKQALPLGRTSSLPKVAQLPNGHLDNGGEPAAPAPQQRGSERERHPVPKVGHGPTFFRSIGKRPLEEGELLIDSDDEVDTTPSIHKQREILNAFVSLSAAEKEFLQTFDSHLLSNSISSTSSPSDTVLQFVKVNKAWPREPEGSSDLTKLVEKLVRDDKAHSNIFETFSATLRTIEQGEAQHDDKMDVDEDEYNDKTNQRRDGKTCKKCAQRIMNRKDGITCTEKV